MNKAFFRQDLILAALLVTLIALMIIPLPQFLMDVLIGLNITLAILLLMVSIYLKQPSDFSTFPAIILYGTAFRLAISIATTRLILTEASAGQIIDTFGKFVISGNLIVGLVIFLIITIVQFIVITKGSERVAEVAARFCLDAMPGKQMSIDVQVRSGALTEEEGIQKRALLDKDNQFYGAMDGAMKFVKGDAIAGLIITAINLIGGIAVGMIIHGFSLGQSLTVFSLLTIGDGLVAQIPALFMSMCAATIITRVTDSNSNDLGTEIFEQLGKYRQALFVASAVVLGFGLIPGFPWMVFVILSGILFLAAMLAPAPDGGMEEEAEIPSQIPISPEQAQIEQAAKNQGIENTMRGTDRYILYLGKELAKAVNEDQAYAYRDNLFRMWERKSGIEFPVFYVGEDDTMGPWQMRVDFDGVPAVSYDLPANCSFLVGNPEIRPLLPKGCQETDQDWLGTRGVWVPESAIENNEELKAVTVPLGHVIMQIPFRIAEQFAGQLFSRVEFGFYLRAVEAKDSDLVNNLIESLGLAQLHNILRKLVEDGVPLSPARLVLETMYHQVAENKDPELLINAIRAAMHRQISHALADEKGILAAVLLDPEIEREFRQNLPVGIGAVEQNIMLPPHISENILSQFYTLVSSGPDQGRQITVVASSDIRRAVRNFLVTNNIHYPVINYHEISSEIQAHPIAMIRLNESNVIPTRAA